MTIEPASLAGSAESSELQSSLIDRLLIRETLERFCVAVDTVDRGLMGACFADNATVTLLGGDLTFTVIDDFLDHLEGMSGVAWSSHSLSNVSIRVDGNEAKTSAVAIAVLLFQDHEHDQILVRGVNYTDEWIHGPLGWRIAFHHHRVAWQVNAQGEVPHVPLP